MNLSNEDFERVARRLDGAEIELTADQQALADELAAEEAFLGPALELAAPPGMLHRVHARVRGFQPRGQSRLWLRPVVTTAAAAVLIAVGLLHFGNGGQRLAPEIPPEALARAMVAVPTPALETQIHVLEDELAEASISMFRGPSELELALTRLADEVNRWGLDDSTVDDEAIWGDWIEAESL